MAEPTKLPSGKWRMQFERHGKRYSNTFETKRECYVWMSSKIDELDLNKRMGIERHTLGEALDVYAEKVSPKKRNKNKAWEPNMLSRFKEEFGTKADLYLDEVTDDILSDWIEGRLEEVSEGTVNREVGLLRNVFSVARKKWKWMPAGHNPFYGLDVPSLNPARTRRPTWSEIRKVCRALDYKALGPIETRKQETALAFLLGCRTAMRSGEMLSLQVRDINLRTFVVGIRAEETKTNKSRGVPMDYGAERMVRRMLAANFSGEVATNPFAKLFRVSPDLRSAYFREAIKKTGIEDLHFHDSRGEALTRLSKKFDVLQLSKISGHANLLQLQRTYYRETPEQMVSRLRRGPESGSSSTGSSAGAKQATPQNLPEAIAESFD